ncbi:MAG TPA: hypothetical protein VJB62_00405 [Patescibacteria group bacterium]|nr:hypothetical protein [Patescibacteria group bacterium]
MITYRLQTQSPSQPPIKFYRTIALSFLAVTILLLGVVIFITSQKANIIIVAKEDNKKVSLTVEIGSTRPGVLTTSGNVSSTLFNYSASYSPTGNKTTDAIATGEVIIYNKSNEEQTLVKTTRLLNPNGVLFRLTDRVIVPANGQIKAQVYADQPGAAGNIGSSQFIIPGLNQERQKAVYAENTTPMIGGTKKVGVLKQEDIDAAKIDYKNKVKQAYLDADNNINNTGILVSVSDADLECDKKAGDEVSEFKISGNNNILALTYDREELAEIINREINSKIDTTLEKILSVNSDPQVTIATYDLEKNTAQLTVTQDVMVTIDANSEKLFPQYFAGKKKNEIEKYLLGLEHVSVASVKLTPGWTRTAPSSPEKIKVVVKNVQ